MSGAGRARPAEIEEALRDAGTLRPRQRRKITPDINVDTRTKIVTATEATHLAMNGATVVTGYFDPLLASHAERLAGLKRPGSPLLVLIATPSAPILPPRARAELVAGLAVVDHVCDTDGIHAPQRYRLEAEDDARLDALIEHVHARQRAGS